MATAQTMIAQGDIRSSFVLEFRTWTGSAYTWTDYTARLTGFGSINMQIEENAYPHAFRIDLNEIRLDNTDGFFDDIDTLDGLLVNAAEAYGKKFYKRILRLSEKRYNRAGIATTTVVFVGLVRDVTYGTDGGEVVLKLISLDARAADQACDGETCNRHPLGSASASPPGTWTTTMPVTATGMVALYRWREKESDNSTFSYGWFKYRRIFDIIKGRRIHEFFSFAEVAQEVWDDVVHRSEDRQEVTGLPTGFNSTTTRSPTSASSMAPT